LTEQPCITPFHKTRPLSAEAPLGSSTTSHHAEGILHPFESRASSKAMMLEN